MTAPARIPEIPAGLGWKHDIPPETLATGIHELDGIIEGCPRGRITEVTGSVSSGRTTLLHAVLAECTRIGEVCAVVDTSGSFDPQSAAAAGVQLSHLLLICCGGNADHALRAADLLLHSGGFGVVALDLCDVPDRELRRIPISCWYRFRRAIENTPTVLLLLERAPLAKACASLLLEMNREQASFKGTYPFQYFEGARYQVCPRKAASRRPASFKVKAQAGLTNTAVTGE
jgi:hypothetical protein